MSEDYGVPPIEGNKALQAPELAYQPRKAKNYNPAIALIGAGGITAAHLKAYQALGLRVTAISDIVREHAEARRDEFFPEAEVYTDHREMLAREDVDVIDVATHVNIRPGLVREALESGRHVLSQKPFVLDLQEGQDLIDLAESKGLKLAVNQNGRWAPYFSYMRTALEQGLIGDLNSINVLCHWDHRWIKDTPFEDMRHMLLYDFAIHWFDICSCFLGGAQAERVFAAAQCFPAQEYRPASMASVILDVPGVQVNMQFHAHMSQGSEHSVVLSGSKGTLRSRGNSINEQSTVELFTEEGQALQHLDGHWFDYGFQGTMAELLCAIEEDREPSNSAASNLPALAAAFAAMKSADTGLPVVPGDVQVLESY